MHAYEMQVQCGTVNHVFLSASFCSELFTFIIWETSFIFYTLHLLYFSALPFTLLYSDSNDFKYVEASVSEP